MTKRALIWCAVSTVAQANDEKESLSAQERDLRAAAQRLGYQVVDVLRVPGFSRDYFDLDEFAAAALDEGIDAGKKLIEYLDYPRHRNPKFDVLMVRDADRFGRTQSLLTRIAEAVLIKMNLIIYSQKHDIIDKSRARWWISMAAYQAAGEMDTLKERYKMGMHGRFKRGYPSPSLPMSHERVRDNRGKLIGCVVREEYRALWHDLTEVLCNGVPWDKVGGVLYERYGHANKDGKPWKGGNLRAVVLSPTFWGHNARHHNDQMGRRDGLWAFDDSYAVPDGVDLIRNVFPPAIEGKQAERLKDELRRRTHVVAGTARTATTNPFSGLIICGGCNSRMKFTRSNRWRNYRCETNIANQRAGYEKQCSFTKRSVGLSDVQKWFNGQLEKMLEAKDPLYFARSADTPDETYIAGIQSEIAQIERKAERLMLQMTTVPEELQSNLQNLIQNAADQLRNLRANLMRAQQKASMSTARLQGVQSAYEEIAAMTSLDQLWELTPDELNRLFFRLLGGKVMVCNEGEIVSITDPPNGMLRRHRRHLP